MFEKITNDQLADYNKHGVSDWKQAFAVTPNNDIDSHLETLDGKKEELSKRSGIPDHLDEDHVDIMKETGEVRNDRAENFPA